MGLLTDILKEIPQAAVLKEKITDIEAKYAASDTENAILKDDLREAKVEIAKLKRQVEELSHKDDLDEIEVTILNRIAHLDYDTAFAENLGFGFNVSPARIEYHIQRLEDLGYAEGGIIDKNGTHYGVTQEGRTFLLKKNLL